MAALFLGGRWWLDAGGASLFEEERDGVGERWVTAGGAVEEWV
jgi:hypothetical protein